MNIKHMFVLLSSVVAQQAHIMAELGHSGVEAATTAASQEQPPVLALPDVPTGKADDTIKVEVGGNSVPMDHLGPIIVNEDGSVSRITNWESLSERERQNTIRIIAKRNQSRLEKLKRKQ